MGSTRERETKEQSNGTCVNVVCERILHEHSVTSELTDGFYAAVRGFLDHLGLL